MMYTIDCFVLYAFKYSLLRIILIQLFLVWRHSILINGAIKMFQTLHKAFCFIENRKTFSVCNYPLTMSRTPTSETARTTKLLTRGNNVMCLAENMLNLATIHTFNFKQCCCIS